MDLLSSEKMDVVDRAGIIVSELATNEYSVHNGAVIIKTCISNLVCITHFWNNSNNILRPCASHSIYTKHSICLHPNGELCISFVAHNPLGWVMSQWKCHIFILVLPPCVCFIKTIRLLRTFLA